MEIQRQSSLLDIHSETKCEKCGIETDEIWVCLCCGKCLCGRFVNKCMVDHSMKEYHLVALSLADLSFWCYVCDCYIINTNPILKPIYNSGKFLLESNKKCLFSSQMGHQIAPNSSYKNIKSPSAQIQNAITTRVKLKSPECIFRYQRIQFYDSNEILIKDISKIILE